MAQSRFWKGSLKLSLVTCAVAIVPAVSDSEKVRFHTLNRLTGNRVESRYIDAETGKAVGDDAVAKGYPRDAENYLILEDEELEAVALESARIVDVATFVPKESIDWLWYDRPHYLVPDDKVGVEAFSVIREAMVATGKVGIARLVLYRRERAVMLEPRGRGIVLWTLRYGDEVRSPEDELGGIAGTPPSDAPSLFARLIDKRTRPWDGAAIRDSLEEDLRKLIAARKKGHRRKVAAKEPPPAGNVVSIVDALKKSIAAERPGSGKR